MCCKTLKTRAAEKRCGDGKKDNVGRKSAQVDTKSSQAKIKKYPSPAIRS
jgi:hypothetical protein